MVFLETSVMPSIIFRVQLVRGMEVVHDQEVYATNETCAIHLVVSSMGFYDWCSQKDMEVRVRRIN